MKKPASWSWTTPVPIHYEGEYAQKELAAAGVTVSDVNSTHVHLRMAALEAEGRAETGPAPLSSCANTPTPWALAPAP